MGDRELTEAKSKEVATPSFRPALGKIARSDNKETSQVIALLDRMPKQQ